MAASDEIAAPPPSGDPALGRRRFRQCLSYARKVFDLDALLGGIHDTRSRQHIATALVMRILFFVGLLRLRSFNALDPMLAEPWMQRALGVVVEEGKKACSVDTLGYVLDRVKLETARHTVIQVNKQAERNKVFREGWYGAKRFVAIDGWELYSSYHRCCSGCLTRKVRVGNEVVTQYYHRYVVALYVDQQLDVVLDIEQVRSADVRKDLEEVGPNEVAGHEGELTAAKRLVSRLHETYGRWLDILLLDALYANGPFFTLAKECGYGVIVTLKKSHNEPFKEALSVWGEQRAERVVRNDKGEQVELWDCPELRTLSTYDGPIRVVRGVVHNDSWKKPKTWCFGVTGKAAGLSSARVLDAGRARWHIENTAFYQFVEYWPFAHVFHHGAVALPALLWIFCLAFNLLQIFTYRQLLGYGRARGKDVTRTFLRLVDEMRGDLARLDELIAWDTS